MLKSYFQCFAYNAELSCLRQTQRRRSKSFVQGFLKGMFKLMEDTTSLSVTDIAGVNQTLNANELLACTGAGRNSANFMDGGPGGGGSPNPLLSNEVGIVVGTGTTAVAPTDYQLATIVNDGTSSGQLEYFPCASHNFSVSATTASFDMERLFRNSSGGSITLNEVGIYAILGMTGVDFESMCIVRDLISPGFAVANGEYMRIVYTISVTE